MVPRLLLVLVVLSTGCASAAEEELLKPAATQPAKPPEKLPPPLTHYMGREIAQTMHFAGAPWLTRDAREREEDSKTLLKALNIKPGQTVCDLGAGNGFYTLPLAKLVGETGRVLAVEIQPEMLDLLKTRAAKEGIKNIDLILGTPVDPKLPDGKIDLLLLVDVYHEFSHPVEMLVGLRRSLAPKGRLALVEFRAEDPDVPIKPEHKMGKGQIRKEFSANGFKLVEEFDKLPWQHLMFFERDEK